MAITGKIMRYYLILIIFIISGIDSLAAKDRPPLVLEPSSAWQIDYADDSCTLLRLFGEGDNKSALIFTRFSPYDSPKMTLTGNPFKAKIYKKSANIQFGTNKEFQEKFIFVGERSGMPALIFSGSVEIVPYTEDQLKMLTQAREELDLQTINDIKPPAITDDIDNLLVKDFAKTPVLLKTGNLVKPMAAMDECLDQLVTTWGIDAKKHKSLSRNALPINNPGSWLTSEDYPRNLLRKGVRGIVNFRLIVDDKGGVESCHIQRSTRPVGFDEAVCKIISDRAKFEPALDDKGQGIKSFYSNSVIFNIPY
jgi:TonB family protein